MHWKFGRVVPRSLLELSFLFSCFILKFVNTYLIFKNLSWMLTYWLWKQSQMQFENNLSFLCLIFNVIFSISIHCCLTPKLNNFTVLQYETKVTHTHHLKKNNIFLNCTCTEKGSGKWNVCKDLCNFHFSEKNPLISTRNTQNSLHSKIMAIEQKSLQKPIMVDSLMWHNLKYQSLGTP